MTTADRGPIDPAAHLARLRARAPLIRNITNLVAMNPMANVLLAIGASPAMVHAREEAAEAVRLVGTPWVLDPVAVGATGYRRDTAARLLERQPTVIRGNASEIIALEAGTLRALCRPGAAAYHRGR